MHFCWCCFCGVTCRCFCRSIYSCQVFDATAKSSSHFRRLWERLWMKTSSTRLCCCDADPLLTLLLRRTRGLSGRRRAALKIELRFRFCSCFYFPLVVPKLTELVRTCDRRDIDLSLTPIQDTPGTQCKAVCIFASFKVLGGCEEGFVATTNSSFSRRVQAVDRAINPDDLT